MDLMYLVANAGVAMRGLHYWALDSIRGTLLPKQLVDSSEGIGSMLPPIVGSSNSSSSSNIISSSTALALLPVVQTPNIQLTLAQLENKGVLGHSVPFSGLHGVHWDSIKHLQEQSIVEVVEDEFGDQQVLVDAKKTSMGSIVVATQPMQAIRFLFRESPLSHCLVLVCL